MLFGNSGQDGIKVFQMGDFVTVAMLLGIRLVFSFKNIVASTSTGMDMTVWVQ